MGGSKEKRNAEIINLFEAGVSIDRIRSHYKVTRKTIGLIINSGQKPELDAKKIVTMYKDGYPLDKIGVHFCVDSSTIKRVLEENGVEIRGWGEHSRIHVFNYRFFQRIDTAEKAYWLGFLFGDGNVSKSLQEVSIGLSSVDRDHLLKFAQAIDLETEDPLRDWSRGEFDYSTLTLSSKDMSLDLFERGAVPNKSMVLFRPSGVPNKFKYDFIRGLVDADGHIYRKGNYFEISLVGSYDLLKWVSEQLPGSVKVMPHKTIWRIRSLAADVLDWATLIYSNSPALERKKIKADEVIEVKNVA